MKNRNNGGALTSRMQIAWVLVAISTLFSCNRSSDVGGDLSDGPLVSVRVGISQVSFEDVGSIGSQRASSGAGSGTASVSHVRKNTVDLDGDYYLVAELRPDTVPPVPVADARSSTRPDVRASVETGAALPGIRYRTVVFDDGGMYVTHKDYVHGQEAGTDTLQLAGGQDYTFIVYSVNSTSVLPDVVFSDPSNMTLATSSVSVAGNQDFMYFRRDMTVSATAQNYLEVVLKHMFSQITTTVDATATGYNVTAVASAFTPHSTSAVVSLGDAGITRSGSSSSAVSFSTYGTPTAISNPTIINAAANGSTSYTISSITVGPVTQTNIVPFTDLSIVPGVKYSLKLNIVPTDEYLTHAGLPAARINGTIWARHNVGADTNLDPDQDPSVPGLHGNYYQWGRNVITGTGTSTHQNQSVNYIANNNPPINSWNSGTEAAPVKAAADPCPTGFRIPTRMEQEQLLEDVVASNIGTWSNSGSNFSAAKVLTSKRKSDVKMTLPAQGRLNVAGNGPNYVAIGVADRGNNGRYFSSYREAFRPFFIQPTNGNLTTVLQANNPSNLVISATIRCIAE